jgi:zinc finger protein
MPESALECPKCGAELKVDQETKQFRSLGQVIISKLICRKCGLTLTDVVWGTDDKPKGFKARIESKEELDKVTIVKSSSGIVKIPSTGLYVGPSIEAQGFVKSVKEFLKDFKAELKEVAEHEIDPEKDALDQRKLARKELKMVNRLLRVEEPYEIHVLDYFGNSALVGPKVKEIKLSKQDVEVLRKTIERLGL